MGLGYDEISEILKLIDGSSCDEFVLETEDIRLVVRRNGANGSVVAQVGEQEPIRFAAESAAARATGSSTAPSAASARAGANVVRAPMVGTFFRSPSPGAPPFVEVGTKVKKGDPVCIVEVMKLFTTIHAEQDGTVSEIGADDAQLVEYGQMLFVIAPDYGQNSLILSV